MNRQRGFTLLEILVALTLFAVVGGTLLQLFQEGLKQLRQSSEHTHATLLARSKLAELQAFDALQPGESEGDFGDGYRWHLALSTASQLDQPAIVAMTPLSATLRITWGDAGNTNAVVAQTLLLSRWTP